MSHQAVGSRQPLYGRLLCTWRSRSNPGERAVRLKEPFAADYEQIRTDLNAAIGQLEGALQTIATSARSIRSGSTEINTASSDLSRRTEVQATGLKQTVKALDQITSAMQKTAHGARQASEAVGSARADAQ
jgi:methyl-accepting chemotaxis protein